MSETPSDQSDSEASAEIKRLLEEIRDIRAQAQEHLRLTEAARKKADDDATYTFQAKVNSEEHSKSAAVYKGTAEADLNSIVTNKKNFEELVASTTIAKANLEADLKVIAENRKASDQATALIGELSAAGKAHVLKIEEYKALAESTRGAIEIVEKAATVSKETTDTLLERVSQLTASASASVAKIEEQKDYTTRAATVAKDTLDKVKSDQDALTAVIERIAKNDEKAANYETKIKDLADRLEGLNNKAESFLPGAASAGLAHSFNDQKTRFVDPQKRWLRTFQWCIGGLVLVAAPSFFVAVFSGFWGVKIETQWEDILRGMAMRLPIVIPLVWLAIYSGRNYMLSLRLEEEYAYKEAISRAFEGYKREMKEITAGDAANPTPLNKFCLNVLTALAERPGRIYEGKQVEYTLASEFKELLEKASDLRNAKTSESK